MRTLTGGVLGALAACCLMACVDSLDPAEGITFDPCAATTLIVGPEVSSERVQSVDDAIGWWRDALDLPLTRNGDGAAIALWFDEAAPVFFGVYQPSDGSIIINSRLSNREQRAVTIAHELGHAFGLDHVDDRVSLMNPGNLAVGIQPQDLDEIERLWGSCH